MGTDAAGADVLEQQYSFNEICHRKRLRWDMRLPEDTANGAWRELTASAVEQAMPVLRELCAGEKSDLLRAGPAGRQAFTPTGATDLSLSHNRHRAGSPSR